MFNSHNKVSYKEGEEKEDAHALVLACRQDTPHPRTSCYNPSQLTPRPARMADASKPRRVLLISAGLHYNRAKERPKPDTMPAA
jgi:hypothetical protein